VQSIYFKAVSSATHFCKTKPTIHSNTKAFQGG